MSFDEIIAAPVRSLFTEKMVKKILSPLNCGHFTLEDAKARDMKWVKGMAGTLDEGHAAAFYWLVDPSDGVIVDAKFQIFGPAALTAAAEAGCELVIGKNYDQAKRIGVELIDKWMRDRPDQPAFPDETLNLLNLVIDAIDHAAEQCQGTPLAQTYISPLPESANGTGYPGWNELSHSQKLAVIEKILDEEVRPYVELDEGGIEILELKELELIIAYQGACTSCFSAIGTTLSSIQQILQNKVHPDLQVTPNLDALKLSPVL